MFGVTCVLEFLEKPRCFPFDTAGRTMAERNITLVSLIIPIYCESQHLLKFLQKIDGLCFDGIELELVFIDDKSSDNSLSILQSFPFRCRHLILTNTKNRGKGNCVRRGIQAAQGDIIGIQDCDFEYDFDDIPKLLTPIIKGEIDVAFSSRFHQANHQVHRTRHYFKNSAITFLSNIFSNLHVTDASTCYKFFRATIIKNLQLSSSRFSIDVEIIANLARIHKLRIKEFPISYHPRSYGEGKKITWCDGVAVALLIIYFNLLRPPPQRTLPLTDTHQHMPSA